jgi:hypothetical protein
LVMIMSFRMLRNHGCHRIGKTDEAYHKYLGAACMGVVFAGPSSTNECSSARGRRKIATHTQAELRLG